MFLIWELLEIIGKRASAIEHEIRTEIMNFLVLLLNEWIFKIFENYGCEKMFSIMDTSGGSKGSIRDLVQD